MSTIFDSLCPTNDGDHRFVDGRCKGCGQRRCPVCDQTFGPSEIHGCPPTRRKSKSKGGG